MADNVTLPVTGTGTADVVQATDDVAGVHYPIVKLVSGTLGETTPIPGGAGGLLVDLGSNNDVTLAAGSTMQVGLAAASTIQVSLAAASTVQVGLAAGSTVQVGLAAGSTLEVDVASLPAVTLAAGSTVQVSLAAASTIQVGLAAASTVQVGLAAGSTIKVELETGGLVGLAVGSTVQVGLAAASTIQVGLAAASTIQVGLAAGSTIGVAGDVAHDAADAGSPVKIGGKAAQFGVNPTAVGTSDRVDWLFSRIGIPFMLAGHPFQRTIELQTTAVATDTAVVSAAGTSQRIGVLGVDFVCDEANLTAVGVRIGFSTATTPTTTGVILSHPGLVPGVGMSKGWNGALLGMGNWNESVRLTHEIPTSGACRTVLSYFTVQST